MVFMTNKEQEDQDLTVKLWKEGIIMTSSELFEASAKKEIDSLIANRVFEFVPYDPKKHSRVCIFNSRLVNKVKGKATKTLYKKSRLVIQAYNNARKQVILT